MSDTQIQNPAGRGEMPTSQLTFDETNYSDIWRIHLTNYALMILTLGFYRFWAITRIRQFIVPRFSWNEDHFDYSGTGRELFFGFLKALCFIFIPIIIITSVIGAFLPVDMSWGDTIVSWGVFFFLFPIFRFLALRYRLSRIHWRGIRGWLSDSPITYGLISLMLWGATVITSGLAWPWADANRAFYLAEHSYFGSLKGRMNSITKSLYGAYFLMILGFIFLVIFLTAIFYGLANVVSSLAGDTPFHIGYTVLLPMGTVITVLASSLWYRAALRIRVLRNFAFGDLSFGFKLETADLFKLMLVNRIIAFGTLWFAMPIVWRRSARFISENLIIYGELDGDTLTQAAEVSQSLGEGVLIEFDFV